MRKRAVVPAQKAHPLARVSSRRRRLKPLSNLRASSGREGVGVVLAGGTQGIVQAQVPGNPQHFPIVASVAPARFLKPPGGDKESIGSGG